MTGSGNLCVGDDYDKEGRILIVLLYTYEFDTFTCMQQFRDGRPDDNGFNVVFDDVIRPWRGGISRAEAVEIPAVTNLCEKIYATGSAKPNAKEREEGKEHLEQRLGVLLPNAALVLGGMTFDTAKYAFANASPRTELFPALHPTAYLRPGRRKLTKEEVVTDIRQAWDRLQTNLRRRNLI